MTMCSLPPAQQVGRPARSRNEARVQRLAHLGNLARGHGGAGSGSCGASIGRAVLVSKDPLPLGAEGCLKIVVWISDRVTGAPVADLKVGGVFARAIDEVMCRAAGRKTKTHARAQQLFAGVGDEQELALENKDEFVLPAVAVEECRGATGRQGREIDAKILEREQVAERPFAASGDARGKRRWIVARFGSGGGRAGQDGAGHGVPPISREPIR